MQLLTLEQVNTLRERGLSDDRIAELAKQRGLGLPTGDTGFKGFATGVAKGLLGTARTTAQLFQKAGQYTLAATTPITLDEAREKFSMKSLEDSTPEGQGVSELLEPKSVAEKTGATAANIASWFIGGSKAAQVGGQTLKGAGYATTKLGIGMSAKEAPLIQAYRAKTPLFERMEAILTDDAVKAGPITNRDTALTQGIFGTESMIGVQAKRGAARLWDGVVGPALKGIKDEVHFPSFINEMREQVRLIPELSRRKELEEGLAAFADDYADLAKISFEKLQQLKEGWAKFLPDKVYKGKPVAGAFREIQNIAAQLSRNKIYEKVGDEVRAAYFDYGNLKNLQELGQKAMTQSKLRGGAGSFVSGLLDMTLTPIATTAGLGLYRAGKGIEFVGAAGLKTVKEVFGLAP